MCSEEISAKSWTHFITSSISAANTSLQMLWDVLMFDTIFSGGVVCPLESVMFTTSRPMGKRSVWTVLTYLRRCDNQVRSKPELIKLLGDTVDLSTFDYSTGTMNSTLIKPRGRMPKTAKDKVRNVTKVADIWRITNSHIRVIGRMSWEPTEPRRPTWSHQYVRLPLFSNSLSQWSR